MQPNTATFQIQQIGSIQRENDATTVVIDSDYRDALKGLDTFSHVIVYWWADRFDEEQYRDVLVMPLPYANDREAGVFSCRAPLRPNLIMSTVCEIKAVDVANGTVQIANIDAHTDTPVIDLKAYFPVMDRVQNARISEDLVGWPEWFPDEGIGLMEHEK